jgi:OTU domain-containing protein 6
VECFDHNALRIIAADFIRKNAGDFAPYLGFDEHDAEFGAYCEKVASPSLGEWGGQIELKALSAALQRPILVVSADAPVVCMSDNRDDGAVVGSTADPAPLRVTYHKHYYTLGEHYNSVCSADDSAENSVTVSGLSI